jgi:thiosulfate reductase cytochrome b subunit
MKRVYLHPLPLRIWHWVNALLVLILLFTGFQLRIAGIPSAGPRHPALWVHRYAGWAMVASCVFWLVYSLATRNLIRHYGVRTGDCKGMLRQAKYYLISIFRGEENPFRPSPDEKFNPLQKLAYGAIMCIFAPILMVTGLLWSDILFIRKYVLLWDIVGVLNAIHVLGAYVFALYLIIHLYMATLGRTAFAHLKAMITGYEDEPGAPVREFGKTGS